MKNRKRILCLLLCGMLAASTLFGCASKTDTASQTNEQTAGAAADEGKAAEPAGEAASSNAGGQSMDTSVMKPWMNSNVVGIVTADTTAELKDDFYLAVNHDWLMNARLKDGEVYEQAIKGGEIVKERCMELLKDEELLKSQDAQTARDAKNLRNYYELYNDWEQRKKDGVEPLRADVEKLVSAGSVSELNDVFLDEDFHVWGSFPVVLEVGPDLDESTSYAVNISPHRLSTYADSAEYKEETGYGKRYREYRDGIFSCVMKKFGFKDEEIAKYTEAAYAFEKEIAGVVMTEVEKEDKDALKKMNNPVSFEKVKEMSPNYPLAEYMEKYGYAKSELMNLESPEYLSKLNELYTDEYLEGIKGYTLRNMLIPQVIHLDKDAYEEYKKLSNKLYGIEDSPIDYEKEAYNATMSDLGDSFCRIYKEKYLSEEMKQDITKMCEDAIAAHREMLSETEWLSEETKAAAIDKLDKMVIHAVYPDKWEDDRGLELTAKEDGGTYFQALEKMVRANFEKDLAKINQKMDPEIWGINILDENAYYDPQHNSINIIPGLFCDAVYTSDMSTEEKCGAIGSIIGHEISHAFDTSGAQFDADGNFANWWKEEDFETFAKRNEKLIRYYDGIVAFDEEIPYSGQLVQTEAVADMAGVKCMLKMAEKIEGFDYDKFFRAYARLWGNVSSKECLESDVLMDSHPLPYLRVNVSLQQFDKFLETYDLKPGDGMYLAPEERILVW